MDPRALRAFFRLGVFIGVCGLVLIFIEPQDSAEFVLSVCSAALGLSIMVGVVLLLRLDFPGWLDRMARRRQSPEDEAPHDDPV